MRIVLAPDLHATSGLTEEIETAGSLLPPRFYAHVGPHGAFWHNRMMLDETEGLAAALAGLCADTRADLCIFLGDLVDIDAPGNLTALHHALSGWPCPTRWLLGNHDIYLGRGAAGIALAANRTQDLPGVRWEQLDGFGILSLDNFIRHSDGTYDQAYRPGESGHTVTYRPTDVGGAVSVLDGEPRLPILLLTHMPFAPPPASVPGPGRKLPTPDAALAPLLERLNAPRRLVAVCGHGHYNALSRVGSGLHWALPSIIEYPCTAAVCQVDGRGFRGSLRVLDADIASRSFSGEAWTAGDPSEQAVEWRW
jgi:3',5'-cyclic AMP phosphodiesterase CpdA